ALNIVIRMEPSLNHKFRSIQPTFNRLLVNIKIDTGEMFKAGPLMERCLEFI
ncbi:hypothetical protein EDD18DRAFT_1024490, partial [Armillaria luteobubalina]